MGAPPRNFIISGYKIPNQSPSQAIKDLIRVPNQRHTHLSSWPYVPRPRCWGWARHGTGHVASRSCNKIEKKVIIFMLRMSILSEEKRFLGTQRQCTSLDISEGRDYFARRNSRSLSKVHQY